MDFERLKNAMADLEEDAVLAIMNEVIEDGGKDAGKALEACQEGMAIVGEKFENGEYFVGDLIYSAEVMTGAIEIIKPALGEGSGGGMGKMILCTVKDDLHDIGKNIVKSMLEAAGFDVIDLGIDVPEEKIIETAKAENINIIGLSGVLTLALDSMKRVVDAIAKEGMRDSVKVIIGGNPVTADTCISIGADEWAHSPQKTVEVCRGWAKA